MPDLEGPTHDKDHSACGVGLIVNIQQEVPSNKVVQEGLELLSSYDYRSGVNPVTEESDGAGIQFFGLATDFFTEKFTLTGTTTHPHLIEGCYAVGQYFLPTDEAALAEAKALIERQAAEQGLRVAAWRDLKDDTDTSAISASALAKKPALWQALLLPLEPIAEVAADAMPRLKAEQATLKAKLERAALRAALAVSNEAFDEKLAIDVVSQSSLSIVYKGMIRTAKVGEFYKDLRDPKFTANAVILHGRYATNTSPKWDKAQPFRLLAHNGEINTNEANATEMRAELKSFHDFKGIYPNSGMSDSKRLDADLSNQMAYHGYSLEEALVRLMPPAASASFSAELNAMLELLSLERSSCNGPAFVVVGAENSYLAKLDNAGLRPSRISIVKDKAGKLLQVRAASDAFLESNAERDVVEGHLEPGGMIMVTPEGELLKTREILARVRAQLVARHSSASAASLPDDYFQQQVQERVLTLNTLAPKEPLLAVSAAATPIVSLSDTPTSAYSAAASSRDGSPTAGSEGVESAASAESTTDESESAHVSTNRKLYAASFDLEAEETILTMAEKGAERVGAMGDDTDPLHVEKASVHIAYFMHQLFAQVSAPPLDSIKELDRFSLKSVLGAVNGAKVIKLNSPILGVDELKIIEEQKQVPVHVLDTSFAFDLTRATSTEEAQALLSEAIKALLKKAEEVAATGGIIVLSDRVASQGRALIPDVIAVAAVRQHLENKQLIRNVSLVADSYQVTGPHHASVLMAMGARAVYARGAYEKITEKLPGDTKAGCENYQHALEKGLLKTMGKMGVTDFTNYSNGQLVAALGLDLTPSTDPLSEKPSLASIFPRIYSPLKGFNLGHVANAALVRHRQAYDADKNFSVLPRSGEYMPEKGGVEHGYGPEVVNAFGDWMKEEELHAQLLRFHKALEAKGLPSWLSAEQVAAYQAERGYLDPSKKNAEGFYEPAQLEAFKASAAFKKMSQLINARHSQYPTSISARFAIKAREEPVAASSGVSAAPVLQSVASILKALYGGGMSRGALTVTNPDHPEKIGAHETLTRALNAIGAVSAAGEGGETVEDLSRAISSCSVKQIASGRFGVTAEQILSAQEIEIKVAQGAKPGEGGQVPGEKITISIAALRGSLPGIDLISPPPHHDIYSIEDLAQLISDIKSVNPKINVSVKLVASEGIGTIAVGVAKAGADIINVAGNSGGTGAALQSSIKSAGLPAELGLAEVHRKLSEAKLRNLVKLRVSGGFMTADDIIKAALLGGDLFELGRTLLLTIGCVMQRTCNESCAPGVAKDGHLFKGNQVNAERYMANLAAGVQERLRELGFSGLEEIRGRTDLLEIINKEEGALYDNFAAILDRSALPEQPSAAEIAAVKAEQAREFLASKALENKLVEEARLKFRENPEAVIVLNEGVPLALNTQVRSFGARLAGEFSRHLKKHPKARLIVKTTGIAGQSYGCFLPSGMELHHTGSVEDGCAKSMSGGVLVISAADAEKARHTITGNVLAYGASGGEIYVNGIVGHRAAILAKGAQIVVEGVLVEEEATGVTKSLPLEYMTSGTAMILQLVGEGLGVGASGGVIFVYDPTSSTRVSDSLAAAVDSAPYESAIRTMLENHRDKANSQKARDILSTFNLAHFKVLIPTQMDSIKTLKGVSDVLKTYLQRKAPLTLGMQVWLEQRAGAVVEAKLRENPARVVRDELHQLHKALLDPALSYLGLSPEIVASLIKATGLPAAFVVSVDDMEDLAGAAPRTAVSTPMRPPAISAELGPMREAGSDPSLLTATSSNSMGSSESSASFGVGAGAACAQTSAATPSSKIRAVGERLRGVEGVPDYAVELREILGNISAHVRDLSFDGAGCSSCGSQSCSGGEAVSTGCPAGKPIHTVNKILKRLGTVGEVVTDFQWRILREAFEMQIQESPFPAYTGAACPAPCESACTESIPSSGAADPKRGGKSVGEGVHIKDIEFSLYLLGRAMNWFDASAFGFKAPFAPLTRKKSDKKLVIVGSGPAAMQMAYRALRDGVEVIMYEKSAKLGGLLRNGIPHHKFDKELSLDKDFASLKAMGLQWHTNAEVHFDADEFWINDERGEKQVIAKANDANHEVVLAVGSGKSKELPSRVTRDLDETSKKKVIQATDFLKVVNDIADHFRKNTELSPAEREVFIKEKLGSMNPRGKKVLVIGGGDTAQDVIRWISRYFASDELTPRGRAKLAIAVRGPKAEAERKIVDSYPYLALTPTKENKLRAEEVSYIGGESHYLVEPVSITPLKRGDTQVLGVVSKKSSYKHADAIARNEELAKEFSKIPREKRVIDREELITGEFDLVICALGFEPSNTLPLVQKTDGLKNVHLVGDAAEAGQAKIIVAAQDNANKVYDGKLVSSLGMQEASATLPRVAASAKAGRLFASKAAVTRHKRAEERPAAHGAGASRVMAAY